MHGETIAEITQRERRASFDSPGVPRVEEIYTPVRYQSSGPIVGVIELYRAPATLFVVLDQGVVVIWVLAASRRHPLPDLLRRTDWLRIQIRLEASSPRRASSMNDRPVRRTDGRRCAAAGDREGAVGLTQASYGGTGFRMTIIWSCTGWSPPIGERWCA